MAKIHHNSNQVQLSFDDNSQNTDFIENERWLPLVNFEQSYELSDFGRLRTVERYYKLQSKIKKVKASTFIRIGNKNGAAVVKIGHKKASVRLAISKAVFLAFFDTKQLPELYIIKHLDKNKFNNHYQNLFCKKINKLSTKLNMLNYRFGELTVTKPLPDGTWECKCDCGNKITLNTQSIRNKSARNCGYGCFNIIKKPADQLYHKIFKDYRNSAKNRNLKFDLSEQQVTLLIKQKCFYCGDRPYYKREHLSKENVKYVGIDRVDSSIGYIETNCVPCCRNCNFAKGSFKAKDWLDWIYKISYQKDKIKKIFQNKGFL